MVRVPIEWSWPPGMKGSPQWLPGLIFPQVVQDPKDLRNHEAAKQLLETREPFSLPDNELKDVVQNNIVVFLRTALLYRTVSTTDGGKLMKKAMLKCMTEVFGWDQDACWHILEKYRRARQLYLILRGREPGFIPPTASDKESLICRFFDELASAEGTEVAREDCAAYYDTIADALRKVVRDNPRSLVFSDPVLPPPLPGRATLLRQLQPNTQVTLRTGEQAETRPSSADREVLNPEFRPKVLHEVPSEDTAKAVELSLPTVHEARSHDEERSRAQSNLHATQEGKAEDLTHANQHHPLSVAKHSFRAEGKVKAESDGQTVQEVKPKSSLGIERPSIPRGQNSPYF
jgi:hypothetical protein